MYSNKVYDMEKKEQNEKEKKKEEKKVKFIVEDWIVDQKGAIDTAEFEAKVLTETEKAYQIEIEGKKEWLPKSQIKHVEKREKPLEKRQKIYKFSNEDLTVKWALEATSQNLMGVTGYSDEELEETFKKWYNLLKKYLKG